MCSAPRARLAWPFFFSSRRRHTSFSRDWSSDVCSSDLKRRNAVVSVMGGADHQHDQPGFQQSGEHSDNDGGDQVHFSPLAGGAQPLTVRIAQTVGHQREVSTASTASSRVYSSRPFRWLTQASPVSALVTGSRLVSTLSACSSMVCPPRK